MRQKDYFLIFVIAVFSGVLSMIVSNIFISTDTNTKQTAEVVEVINEEFITPPAQYYNNTAVNPTKLIEIGTATDPAGNPFSQ